MSVTSAFFPRDEHFMRLALREAERALEHEDVPIGCVIVHEGEVVAAARNERELRGDPTAHAELLALREASAKVEGWRLLDTVLYVTLEPCAMCAGAIVLARVPRVVYAAPDPKAGMAGSVLDVLGEPLSTTAPTWRPACWPTSRRRCCAPSSPAAAARPAASRSARRASRLDRRPGWVPEWLNGAVSKTVVRR